MNAQAVLALAMTNQIDPNSPFARHVQEEAHRLMVKYGEDAAQVAEDMQGTYREPERQAAFWEAVAMEIVRREG